MIDSVNSRSARPGGEFRFKTLLDAHLDGGIFIKAGTVGWGVIRSADAAGRHNHDGSLALEPRYILVPDDKTKDAPARRVDVSMNPTLPVMWGPGQPLLEKGLGHVPLPVPGLAMTAINTVRWGRNITLGPGFKFSVLPLGNLSLGPIC